MTDVDPSDKRKREAAERFLERDFDQCFSEKRRYEDAAWDVTKFTFTAYSAILGVAIGTRQFSVTSTVDLTPVAVGLLAVGVLIGVFALLMVVRNRVYFVLVTRYINEQRRFFLAEQPLGFQNEASLFTDPRQPPFFSWGSTQSWAALLIATLNSLMAAVLVFILLAGHPYAVLGAVVAGLAIEVGQSMSAVLYLKSRENKTAEQAAYGNNSG